MVGSFVGSELEYNVGSGLGSNVDSVVGKLVGFIYVTTDKIEELRRRQRMRQVPCSTNEHKQKDFFEITINKTQYISAIKHKRTF